MNFIVADSWISYMQQFIENKMQLPVSKSVTEWNDDGSNATNTEHDSKVNMFFQQVKPILSTSNT